MFIVSILVQQNYLYKITPLKVFFVTKKKKRLLAEVKSEQNIMGCGFVVFPMCEEQLTDTFTRKTKAK